MAARSLLMEGDYALLSQYATWQETARGNPYVRVFARVVAYYRLQQGVETAHYEELRVPRTVTVFLDEKPERGHINVLLLRAIGWRGKDVSTIGEDAAQGVLFRAHCSHKPGKGKRKDDIIEDWRVVLWDRHWGQDTSDKRAEEKAQAMLEDALNDLP